MPAALTTSQRDALEQHYRRNHKAIRQLSHFARMNRPSDYLDPEEMYSEAVFHYAMAAATADLAKGSVPVYLYRKARHQLASGSKKSVRRHRLMPRADYDVAEAHGRPADVWGRLKADLTPAAWGVVLEVLGGKLGTTLAGVRQALRAGGWDADRVRAVVAEIREALADL